MPSAYRYLFNRLKSVYTPREARAVALLLLDKLCHLSVVDICAGRDKMHFKDVPASPHQHPRESVGLSSEKNRDNRRNIGVFSGNILGFSGNVLVSRDGVGVDAGDAARVACANKHIISEERDVYLGKGCKNALAGTDSGGGERVVPGYVIERLLRGEPVQYVLGECDFCGRSFVVTPDVLIPRPETAELTLWVVDEVKGLPKRRILDIGTGSGCIAVTLSKELRDARVTAIDISPAALSVARENAERHDADVTFREGDILSTGFGAPHTEDSDRWDVIVSNPPYVCRSEREGMGKEVRDYEPDIALFVPDDDPLVFYRHIVHYAVRHLSAEGKLFVEINERFGNEVSDLFRKEGFSRVEVRKDMQGRDRMIKCIRI